MSKRSQPICIVGAGPAGLVSALTLVQRGILPVIFEKSSGHRSRSRATGLQSDTLKIFDALGVGKDIREMATPIFGSFVSKNGHPHRYIKFADKDAPTPDNLSLNQADTEAVLIEALHRRGADIQWGIGVDVHNDGQLKASNESKLTAEFIIAADGRNSDIRNSLGIDTDRTLDDEISFGCDATIDISTPLDHENMHQLFCKEDRVVFVPLPGNNRFKISGTYSNTVARYDVPDEETLSRIIFKRSGIKVGNISDIFLYRLGSIRSVELYKGNVALAGDAAQTFYPNGGFGLNTAVQQAYHLAELVSSNSSNPLKEYQSHWISETEKRFKIMNSLRSSSPK